MGSCDRYEKRIYAKKMKSISIVERRERGSERIYQGTVKERVHQTLKVAPDGAGVLCRQEGWKEENGTRISISQ